MAWIKLNGFIIQICENINIEKKTPHVIWTGYLQNGIYDICKTNAIWLMLRSSSCYRIIRSSIEDKADIFINT